MKGTNYLTASKENNGIKTGNKGLSFIRTKVEVANGGKVVKDPCGIIVTD